MRAMATSSPGRTRRMTAPSRSAVECSEPVPTWVSAVEAADLHGLRSARVAATRRGGRRAQLEIGSAAPRPCRRQAPPMHTRSRTVPRGLIRGLLSAVPAPAACAAYGDRVISALENGSRRLSRMVNCTSFIEHAPAL